MSQQLTSREMYEIKSIGYTPPPGHRGSMMDMGLPNFTLRQVEQMRRDSQVKLGMAIKTAPLMHVKFECTGRPDIVQFVTGQMKSIWDEAITKISSALWYKVHASEPVYRKNQNTGLMEISGLRDFYPGDVEFLEQSKQLIGLRIRSYQGSSVDNPNGYFDLLGMKGFHYIHRQEFGGRNGVSELEAAYQPWLAKVGPDGAMAVRTMWFYKNAYDSGIIFHPPGVYEYIQGGNVVQIPYRDLARQAVERATSGAVWAFPQSYDEKGNRMWEFVSPKLNGDGKSLIDYVEQLNVEILRGMGIPDDIISQTGGTGSYAGRSIPFQAFLTSQNDTVRAIFQAIEKQILANLAMWNFGSRDFEFHGVEVDCDKLLPSDQPQPPAGMAPPEMGGDPSQDPSAMAAAQAGQPMQPAPAAAA